MEVKRRGGDSVAGAPPSPSPKLARQPIQRVLAHAVRLYATTMRSLYLPDEVSFYTDSMIRLLFSLYYLPGIVLVLSLTHSALERVAWSLIVPVTQTMEQQPYSTSQLYTLLMGLGEVGLKVAPFTTISLAVATVGHKTANCVAEAMVDSYITEHGKDFPFTRARMRFMMRKTSRMAIFAGLAVLITVAAYLGSAHLRCFDSEWRIVFMAASFIILAESSFIISTLIHGAPTGLIQDTVADTLKEVRWPSSPHLGAANRTNNNNGAAVAAKTNHGEGRWEVDDHGHKPSSSSASGSASPIITTNARRGSTHADSLIHYIEDEWWSRNIYRLRFIAFWLAVAFSFVFFVRSGPLSGAAAGVVILITINVAHLYGYAGLSLATAVIRIMRSFQWLGRHPDAATACLLVMLPYQALIAHALCYFWPNLHVMALLVLVGVLLTARSIDLVREFDCTQDGSVHWQRMDTGELVEPYLAIVLEDGYEKRKHFIDVVSLEFSIDIKGRRILYAHGASCALRRTQVIPYGAARRYLTDPHFFLYVLPRLLSLQSPGHFGGSKFRVARVVLRIISITLLLVFAAIVSGMLIQAAFQELRPIPVRITSPADASFLTFDHIVVRMHLLSQEVSRVATAAMTKDESLASWGYASPVAAHMAFKWHNVTSSTHEDFYPQLCQRDYYGTTVWELALLALAPYLIDAQEILAMLAFLNEHLGSDWVIRERVGDVCTPGSDDQHQPTGWAGYYDFFSSSRNTSIIAIRGTDMFSFKDFLIDINLFFETVLYEFMTVFVPGAGIIPHDVIVRLIKIASLAAPQEPRESWEQLLHSPNRTMRGCLHNNHGRDFYADIGNHIAAIALQDEPPRNLVLTGHSLGGAVAAIVAAQVDVKAVAFSSPGVLLGRERYGVDLRSIHKNVLTVVSSNDIVSGFGEHGGEVQHVECLAATRELCHAMEFLIGSIWRSCGTLRDKFPAIKDVV